MTGEWPTFDPGFSTPEMTEVLGPTRRVGAMLEVEAGVARAQARAGVIPVGHADRIADACALVEVAPLVVATEGWEVGTPVVPLLDAIRSRLDPAIHPSLHLGMTTQDVVDTSMMLVASRALGVVGRTLDEVAEALAVVVASHRSTPVVARTMLQPGEVTSFGLVAAGWMGAVDRHRHVVDAARQSLPVQLGGPVGTLAAFGSEAVDVLDMAASELGLSAPVLPWHADRSPVAALATELAALGGTVDKISTDLVLLASFGEVRMRPGGSSAMPHKRNPIDAVRARAAAVAGRAAASAIAPGGHELQRAAGAWHAEWWGVPMAFHCIGAAVAALGRAIATLEVDERAMRRNIAEAGFDVPEPVPGAVLVDRALAARTREESP